MPEEKKEEGLGIFPDLESKKLAEEIARENEAKADKPKEVPKESEEDQKKEEKPEEKKEEAGEDKKDEDKEDEDDLGEEDDEDEGEKSKRTPKLMPLFKHKIAESNWMKEKGQLEEKIKILESQTKDKSPEDKQEKLKQFAEKNGMNVESLTELVGLLREGDDSALRKEVDSLKEQIKKNSEEAEKEKQNRLFIKEFEKDVVPLMEKDGISPENRKKAKKLLQSLAFTEEFGRTPLRVIYKGHDSFEDFKVKGRKSGESSGSAVHVGEDKEKKIMDMSDEEFMKESERLANETKKTHLRRDGKDIDAK